MKTNGSSLLNIWKNKSFKCASEVNNDFKAEVISTDVLMINIIEKKNVSKFVLYNILDTREPITND